MLERAISLKKELQRGSRKIRDILAEKIKENGKVNECTDNSHVT
jgi:hypothetical protein